jgi:hypothetical protein
MLIERKSIFTGVVSQMELPITQAQLDRWQNTGALIQDVFPHLSPEQREFLQSGATPEEWDRLFPEEDDDEE